MHSTGLRQRQAAASIVLRRGITFVELLLVLAIYALLMSILLPGVAALRSRGMTAKCLANLHEIGRCTALYTHAQQGSKLIPWYQVPPHQGYSPTLFTPWVFGGFKAPKPDPASSQYTVDAEIYPAEVRPLNKFADRQARGNAIIDLYVCPADRTHHTAVIGQGWHSDPADSRASWEVNGSSYSLNTRWAQGYKVPSGVFSLNDFHAAFGTFPKRIAKHMIAGEASKFIMWVEQSFYSATYMAGPTIAGIGSGPTPLRYGWHRGFSEYPVGFADGHARYGFYDTRTVFGLGGTIWQPNFQHGL